ncbi:unnamed protein product [Spirodela intermedia]|uniref:Uncharacterized protein n=1 Tax=Spirodela intermedia TaxID=51605 RepID=A0A7I8JXZ3_SPIIN|nr:unnamed protein product [Spirodela intermedia]
MTIFHKGFSTNVIDPISRITERESLS